MPFAAALSTKAQAAQALEDICTETRDALGGPPDLAVLFYSPHHRAAAESLAAGVRERLAPRCLLGCPGEAIVGNDREVEKNPALSLWLGRWSKKVTLTPMHLVHEATPDGHSLLGWPYELGDADPAASLLLVLADPYTFPPDALLNEVNEAHKGLRVVGGMASGVRGRGQCRLLLDGRVVDRGAVGVLLQGHVGARTVVSQGCRPIGKHMVVTKARDNVIVELSGKPPLAQLQQ